MVRRFTFLGALGAIVALAFVLGGGTPRTQAFVAPGVQDFDVDMLHCLLPDPYPPDLLTPDPMGITDPGPPQNCPVGEAKGVAGTGTAAVSLSTGIGLIEGNRLGYPYVYSGPGWGLLNDAAIVAPCDDEVDNDDDGDVDMADLDCVETGDEGTIVGDVASATDLFQDDDVDIMAKKPPANCPGGAPCAPPVTLDNADPQDYVERTTAWHATSGCTQEDESYLSEAMPGVAAMVKYVRYRACIDTLYLAGTVPLDLIAFTGNPTPLNLVTLTPNWSPAGTTVNLVLLAGAANSPTTGSVGTAIQSPQASKSHTNAPYGTNPVAPGLYARWMTEISAADEADRTLTLVLSTNCKAIGNPPAQVDADWDCWDDAVDTNFSILDVNADGWPDGTDQDGDFLPDGIEVAWGSDPNDADTDDDGRTDLEEMIGPSQLLSDPTDADTDDDEVDDGGYKVDCLPDDGDGICEPTDGDGVPDFPDENGDAIADTGFSGNLDVSADGSSHVRIGVKIVGKDILADGAGMDNCPSIPNAGQANTDYDTPGAGGTGLGNGDVYGDACDTDDDQDEIVDGAELTYEWDGVAGACSNNAATATPLDPLDPDTDGDGYLDGMECHVGSDPIVAASVPAAPAGPAGADSDKDGLTTGFETFQRSQSLSDQRAPRPVGDEDVDSDGNIGDADFDSDNDGMFDACEALATGTSLLSLDTDDDGVPDNQEPGARFQFLEIGNGSGLTAADTTIPNAAAVECDDDADNDGIPDASDPDPAAGQPVDVTYDDDGDGNPAAGCLGGTDADGSDDGPSWDTDCNAIMDGWVGDCGSSTTDADGDGLMDKWENCKWGTDPNDKYSDADGINDCREACDVDGNGACKFTTDVIYNAMAALLPAAVFGKDGDFDIDGNNAIKFTTDTITLARFALLPGDCKDSP